MKNPPNRENWAKGLVWFKGGKKEEHSLRLLKRNAASAICNDRREGKALPGPTGKDFSTSGGKKLLSGRRPAVQRSKPQKRKAPSPT